MPLFRSNFQLQPHHLFSMQCLMIEFQYGTDNQQNIVMDSQSKTLSKTYFTQELPLSTLEIEPQTIKEKLQLILETLQEEIQANTRKFQQEKDKLVQSIREKDEIIERLAKANSELTVKNQQFHKLKLRESIHNKAKVNEIQAASQKQKEHLLSVIKYLEDKNEELSLKAQKYETEALRKNVRPHQVKYLGQDFSAQLSKPGIQSANLAKGSSTILCAGHSKIESRISRTSNLNKVKSAKYLSGLMKTEPIKKENEVGRLSPIKKNYQQRVLLSDKRLKLSKYDVQYFMENEEDIGNINVFSPI